MDQLQLSRTVITQLKLKLLRLTQSATHSNQCIRMEMVRDGPIAAVGDSDNTIKVKIAENDSEYIDLKNNFI